MAILLFTACTETKSQALAPYLCKYVQVPNIGLEMYTSVPDSLQKYEEACPINRIEGVSFADASYAYVCRLSLNRNAEIVNLIERDPQSAMKMYGFKSLPIIEDLKNNPDYKKSKAILDAFGYNFVSEALHMKTTYIARSSHMCCENFFMIFLLDKNGKLTRMLKTLDELDAEKVTLKSVDAAILWGRLHRQIFGNLCEGSYQKNKNGWVLDNIPLSENCTPTGTKTLVITTKGKIETMHEEKPENLSCAIE